MRINFNSNISSRPLCLNQEVRTWTPPPIDMVKLNFDGASKGNLGQAGYGGAFRGHDGNPIAIFMGSIGWDTNNSAELEGLWRGLILAHRNKLFPLIIEGDSQILIRIAIKLQNGSPVHKVSSSWRMAHRLESLNHWLSQNQSITFNHTKREGNRLADLLANFGVEAKSNHFEGTLDNLPSRAQRNQLREVISQDIAQMKKTHPDAGVLTCN